MGLELGVELGCTGEAAGVGAAAECRPPGELDAVLVFVVPAIVVLAVVVLAVVVLATGVPGAVAPGVVLPDAVGPAAFGWLSQALKAVTRIAAASTHARVNRGLLDGVTETGLQGHSCPAAPRWRNRSLSAAPERAAQETDSDTRINLDLWRPVGGRGEFP